MKIFGIIFVISTFTSCVMDSDVSSTEFHVWNKSGYSPIVGLFFNSNKLKDTFDSSYVSREYVNYNFKKGEYLQQWDKIPLDWNYFWVLYLGDHDSFENAYNFYRTDTMSVLFTTSMHNLRKWFSTQDDLYIVDMFSFSKDDVRDFPNHYDLVYNPPSGCCVYIDSCNYEKVYVGMYFHSTATTGTESGIEQTGSFSIIGEYDKQESANKLAEQSIKCPLGYSKAQTFGEFFIECKTDEIQILVAESEDQLIDWEKSQNESLLLYKKTFTLQQLGADNNSLRIKLSS